MAHILQAAFEIGKQKAEESGKKITVVNLEKNGFATKENRQIMDAIYSEIKLATVIVGMQNGEVVTKKYEDDFEGQEFAVIEHDTITFHTAQYWD